MRLANKIKQLFGNLFGRHRAEDTLHSELRAYVDELTHHNIDKGLPPDEARRQAFLESGGIEQIKEEVREAWLGQGIYTTFQDIRYACRSLLRSPWFTAVVIATLALGVGAALTMFSLMRAVLWRPLPYPEPDRIVMIQVDAIQFGDRRHVSAGVKPGQIDPPAPARDRRVESVGIDPRPVQRPEYETGVAHLGQGDGNPRHFSALDERISARIQYLAARR